MEGEDQKPIQSEGPKKGKLTLIIVIILVLVVAGLAGYFVFGAKSKVSRSNVPVADSGQETSTNSSKGGGAGTGGGGGGGRRSASTSTSTDIRWEMSSDGTYTPSGTPPTCPSPLVLEPPADLSKAISILYPGQYRGGNYKPHGGFRFPDGANDVLVTAPMDASVVNGGRYLVDGEIQYTFDFVNDCGIKYRLGHFRTLSPAFAALAEKLPEAKEMDSRTTKIEPPVKIKAGDPIATAVGLTSVGNAFFDFGVYDLRQTNEASKSAAFQSAHADDPDLAWHAVCWFDLLSPANEAIVRGLPATAPGSESDYCK